MIRFEQRNFDLQGTEKVFKKVVHSGQNAIRLVDKDGVPLRTPNNLTFSRLHSTYTLTPRGVPTRKSNHAYSGQPAQAKMQTLVNSLDTSSQEMDSYNALNGYGKRLNSAGSSRQYQSTAGSSKKKANDPSRSVKSFDKSATRERTRLLVSAPSAEQMIDPNGEKSNESPQGKRLEKEWSALSQCRALKRSSEIVSHRVDRMYFMTGNKLRLQAKYQVDDGDIQQLRELQHARDSARSTRSGRSKKADMYRPDRHLHNGGSVDANGDHGDGAVQDGKRLGRLGSENGHMEPRDPQVIVSQKVLQPKPASRQKSPLLGWGSGDATEKDTTVINDNFKEKTLHDNEEANYVEDVDKNADAIRPEDSGQDVVDSEDTLRREETDEQRSSGEQGDVQHEPVFITHTEDGTDISKETDDVAEVAKDAVEKGTTEDNGVHREDELSVISDKDKIDIKTEDYLQ
ncbi:uncharacterized protein LOC127844731 isoform X2 [Dreissena polymorpha]|uniref:Uncharacterized protein n=1 Tax=Dreissena polymorpha TaxID=45954 RepID=A0A9D4E0Z4_DREPO|nr:uncharacterized protein LOC127844731 isoform X2 [Dreissena polymorpha]KAH3771762.1 hypothetical protein DPMN_173089 [Dreissena polymorpha]